MVNRFKQRNFDGHVWKPSVRQIDTSYSDSSAALEKGKSFDLVPFGDDGKRLISDVEIAMSDDPNVASLYPDEYRSALRGSLMNQPHSPIRPSLPDDSLSSAVVPQGLERDERVRYVRSVVTTLDDAASSLPNPKSQPQPQPQPQPQSD